MDPPRMYAPLGDRDGFALDPNMELRTLRRLNLRQILAGRSRAAW